MKKINVLEYLNSTEELLKDAHTPKPYEFNFTIEVYGMENKEFWIKYQEDHPDHIIRFFDKKGNTYQLIRGELA